MSYPLFYPSSNPPIPSTYISPRFTSPQSHNQISSKHTYGSVHSHRDSYQLQTEMQKNRSSNKSYASISKPKAPLPKGSSVRQSIPKSTEEVNQSDNKNSLVHSKNRNQQRERQSKDRKSEIPDKYPSRVSILKSDISVLTHEITSNIHLPKLETSIMEHILTQQEIKIALLDQLSHSIDQKNKVEREIHKIHKDRHRMGERLANENIIQVSIQRQMQIKQLNPNFSKNREWADKNQYYPAIERYLLLKSRLNQLQETQKQNTQSQQAQPPHPLKDQYQKYQRLNSNILETSNLISTSKDFDQLLSQLHQRISQLQQQRQQFQSTIDLDKFDLINSLRQHNAKLIAESNHLLAKKKRMGQITSIDGLNKLIRLEDGLKEEIFAEMKGLKRHYQVLKRENDAMRTALNDKYHQ